MTRVNRLGVAGSEGSTRCWPGVLEIILVQSFIQLGNNERRAGGQALCGWYGHTLAVMTGEACACCHSAVCQCCLALGVRELE